MIFEKKFKIAVSAALVPLNIVAEWPTNDTTKTMVPGPIQTWEVVASEPGSDGPMSQGNAGWEAEESLPPPG